MRVYLIMEASIHMMEVTSPYLILAYAQLFVTSLHTVLFVTTYFPKGATLTRSYGLYLFHNSPKKTPISIKKIVIVAPVNARNVLITLIGARITSGYGGQTKYIEVINIM